MAKTKKISVNAFEKAIKENIAPNINVEEWCGIEISITNTISLKDMISLVTEVTDNCFMDDGRYIPEVMQPLLDCGVVEKYTNINLPSSFEARYDLVMRSGILDFILPKINSNQYNDIVVAVRDRIEYMCDTNMSELKSSLTEMVNSMNVLQEKTAELFGNIDPHEVQRILSAFGDSKDVEERIVDTYIDRQKSELKIVGDE